MICEYCGSHCPEDAIYCPSCGSNLKMQKNYGQTPIKEQVRTEIAYDQLDHMQLHLTPEILRRYNEIEARLGELDKINLGRIQHQAHVQGLQAEMQSLQAQLNQAKQITQKEFKDFDDLQHLSWKSLGARIKGNRNEAIAKEQKEYLSALAQQQALEQSIQNLSQQLNIAQRELENIIQLERQQQSLIQERSQLLDIVCKGVTDPVEDQVEIRLETLYKQREPLSNNRQILKNALSQVQVADQNMLQALKGLKSAHNYSDWDTFFGGGLFVDSMKHSRISDAQQLLQQSQQNLSMAYRMVPQLPRLPNFQINSPNFFFDAIFDNIFSDIRARRMIEDSERKVQQAHQFIQNQILGWLNREIGVVDVQYQKLNSELEQTKIQLDNERRRMIQEAIKL